jgi:hypothetical protein
MPYFVSRQACYYSHDLTVEVAAGGLDYAGPDMLVSRYPGEGKEFNDPQEAVETAIEICRAWRKDGEKRAKVACGSTGGMGIEIEPDTFPGARAWAKKVYAALPKCDGCGDLMGKEKFQADDWSGSEFCSERCAEREAEFQAEETEKFQEQLDGE